MNDPPPAIQPHGFLVGLSDDWLVRRASANVADFLGRGPDKLIGDVATKVFSVDAVHALRNRLALLRGPNAVERLFRCRLTGDDREYDVAVHQVGDETILEAEPSTGKSYGDVSGTIRGMIQRLDGASSFTDLLGAGIAQLRAMTGFDRVAVKRIAGGEARVVAECMRSGMPARLGEVGPPMDHAALSLHRRRAMHVIADVAAAPVPIVPAESDDGAVVDLSLAVLRAPDPEEVERLIAAGVQASMTIALDVGGRLWGLIECHHHFARSPGFERRAMADLFAQMFALRIRIRELEGGA